ncbi:hypothetical protein [Methylobacterium durans]|uniref:hypothetical protein n=1 Tax=Methylobacterium durans TaxID=2202825 RepID=UPI0013A5B124|nr:hypothetical protein [Methylobacterium durans]
MTEKAEEHVLNQLASAIGVDPHIFKKIVVQEICNYDVSKFNSGSEIAKRSLDTLRILNTFTLISDEAARMEALQAVERISHRSEGKHHPDP